MSQGSLHEQTSITGHTPLYWREWLSIIMVRYGARMLEGGLENYARRTDNKALADWIKKDDGTVVDLTAGAVSSISFLEHFRYSGRTITKMFAETVALEKGKDPDKVGFFDLVSSKNEVVKKTISNYFYFNGLRAISSGVFFARPLARALLAMAPGLKIEEGQKYNDAERPPSTGKVVLDMLANTTAWELGMAVTGLLYYAEQKRSMTVFETLHRMVAESFNFERTLVVNPNVNAIYNVYQTHQKALKTGKDIKEPELKEEAKVIFQRIAELFGESYNKGEANFKLPQYMHLMGFRKIDPANVEKTLLYIEAINKGGVGAVNEVDKKLAAGSDVKSIAASIGVEVDVDALRKRYETKKIPSTTFTNPKKLEAASEVAAANLESVTDKESSKKKPVKDSIEASKLLEEVQVNKLTSHQTIQ